MTVITKARLMDGLVLYLPMSEGVGSKVFDHSLDRNNGTLSGPVWINRIGNPYIPRANAYKGQLHSHTMNSDGVHTPVELATAYLAAGYDFLAITDHGFITPDPEVGGILHINGTEEATEDGHMGELNITGRHTGTDSQTVINSIVADDGITDIPHPAWVAAEWTEAELAAITDYRLLEIYNYVVSTYSLDKWNYVLGLGEKVWGIAVDDCHGAGSLDKAWIVAYADAITAPHIVQAIRQGNFYSSNGPDLAMSVVGNIVTATTTGNSTFVWTNKAGTVMRTSGGATATDSYTILSSDVFIRVQAEQAGPLYSWSNPIQYASPDALFGKGLLFDGLNDKINVGNAITITDALTASCWFNCDWLRGGYASTGGIYQIWISRGSGNYWLANSTRTSLRFTITTDVGGRHDMDTTIPFNDGLDHLLTNVYDGAEMITYLDGRRVNSIAKTGVITATADILIGTYGVGYPYDGVMGPLRLWDRGLDEYENRALFEMGRKI